MANETLKLLWGKNSNIPTKGSSTNGKAYFAVIDGGYTDTAAPTKEAFIYFDKDDERYNVIAKRAIFDSLGNKIVNKYFALAQNSNSNTMLFFAPSQDTDDTPVGSAQIITAIDVKHGDITDGTYNIKTLINGYEDTKTGTGKYNSTLSLNMASDTLAGLMSATSQTFGGAKTFIDDFTISNVDNGGCINFTTTDMYFISDFAQINAGEFEVIAETLTLSSDDTVSISATNSIDLTGVTRITGNTSITGTLGVTGITSITNNTDASSSTAALQVTGGALINQKLYVKGISTFANETDASSTTTAGVKMSGGLGITKGLYVGYALHVGRSVVLNSTASSPAVTNSYSTAVYGPFTAANSAILSRNVTLNNDEPASLTTNTYTTTVKGKSTFNKEASFLNGVIITGDLNVTGDGIFSGDVYARGGEVVIGAAGDCATLSYTASTDTLTISFPS